MHFLAEMERRLDSTYGVLGEAPGQRAERSRRPLYLRRNVWLTYISDPVGLINVPTSPVPTG